MKVNIGAKLTVY